ncbi:hypothetical protein RirG_239230 [Rhizophagus irregularis DAOM 197198w]|uniref:Protein kinase domain-containing protein n=1 Tax=Rhizophagus irregularis (strain DAOM 197198w) TaxID=1432141 RepID=A0A015LGE8_RHIIW|nr:hypothetical protein RirG_239230 [Rhizophagus irregularis DAOM 197198w]
MLYEIISGLSKIHGKSLIHCDFHDGNILNHNDEYGDNRSYISDLGLCQPVKSFLKNLSICKGERPEIIENTPQCYVDLMKKCWNEDPLKRPSTSEVKGVIKNWIFRPYYKLVSEELKSNIMEFIDAPIGHYDLAIKSHPKAYYTSRLHDFTSEKLNEILESENLDNYMIKDLKSLGMQDIKADENTSENLSEILESEDSQVSVKVNEILVSEDLNDYII